MYGKAIQKNPNESTFYSNRARCYKQLSNYDLALKDITQSISLNDKNIKAYLILG